MRDVRHVARRFRSGVRSAGPPWQAPARRLVTAKPDCSRVDSPLMGRRGEGTVYRRRDGRWSGQIRRPDGVRQTVYGRTEEEARERLAAVRRAIGRATPDAAGTVADLEGLRRLRTAIRRLARSERASNVRVFGSVARGDSTATSDYDLIVDLDPEVRGFEAFDHLDRLERLLAELLDRPVHVVTARHDSDFTRRVLRDAIGL